MKVKCDKVDICPIGRSERCYHASVHLYDHARCETGACIVGGENIGGKCSEEGAIKEYEEGRLRFVEAAIQDYHKGVLSRGAALIAIRSIVTPQPEPTEEELAWAKREIIKADLSAIDCRFLVPASEEILRPHCDMGDGSEGDCPIYLGKTTDCLFCRPREEKP